jgi:acetate kinase
MKSNKNQILITNGGSSSIKFAMYQTGRSLNLLLRGQIESIGDKNPGFSIEESDATRKKVIKINAADFTEATNFLIEWIKKQKAFVSMRAIGHRIVHGMNHSQPEKITPKLLNELKINSAYDPDHLPAAIKLIESFQKNCPGLPQIACFDTSFHSSMPVRARLLPIPRKYYSKGIRRYGFHGLSYCYLMEELHKISGSSVKKEKIILAHLGSGASLAAIKEGKSIDTSMAFTPAGGIPMSTRTGDIDPGVAWYLFKKEKLTAKQFSHLINHESGLLGVSETNSDMRELIKLQAKDNRAAEAIELFCYQAKKWIGSFAAALGGLDTLVFSGGIGENSWEIRERICEGLQFLGVELNEKGNKKNEAIISADHSNVTVRVIKTNEEFMIAKLICRVLDRPVKH